MLIPGTIGALVGVAWDGRANGDEDCGQPPANYKAIVTKYLHIFARKIDDWPRNAAAAPESFS
jgi:hypothetical protein